MIDLIGIYKLVSERIDKIDFEKIWRGFKRYKFALYTSKYICMDEKIIPYNESFLGNSSIFFDGEHIAIWNFEMDPVMDLDILTANIIHEMFHCYQRENSESRYPDDLKLLLYPNDLKNYIMKSFENSILVDSLDKENIEKKMVLFKKFCSIRSERSKIIKEAIQNEYYTETIEGTAEYVGTRALRIISEEKYNERIRTYKKIIKDDENIFDIRKISYYVGVLYFKLLEELKIDFEQQFENEVVSIYEKTCDYNEKLAVNIALNKDIIIKFNSLVEIRTKIMNSFDKSCMIYVDDCIIIGYDPMNMFRLDDYVVCNHFVFLSCDSDVISIHKPVMLLMKNNSPNEVIGYCLKNE